MSGQLSFDAVRPLVAVAVRRILETEDFEAFVDGFAEDMRSFVARADLDPDAAENVPDPRGFAHAFGRVLWNATPLPSNDWRPRSLPTPGRNDPCPCGSGRKFKQCCATLNVPAVPSPQAMWPFVLAQCAPAQVVDLVARKRVAIPAVCEAALVLLDDELAADAWDIVEALLDHAPDTLSPALAPVVRVMAIVGTEADRGEARDALLARLVASGPAAVASEALLAQAMLVAGEERWDEAGALIREAQQRQPDSITAASAELDLLTDQGRFDEARVRARELHRQFSRHRDRPEEFIEYLEDMVLDPRVAMLRDAMADPELPAARFLGMVERLAAAPLGAGYRRVEADTEEDLLPTDHPLDDEPRAPRGGIALECPELAPVEEKWRGFCALEPGDDDDDESFDLGTSRIREALDHPDPWLRFLERTPRAADSLAILADLATSFRTVQPADFDRAVGRFLLIPVLDRAWRITQAAMAGAGPDDVLADNDSTNTLALEMCGDLVRQYVRAERDDDAEAVGRTLLGWDPDDSEFVRDDLMLLALRQSRWESAIDLANDFAEDDRAVITFSHALALFGKGDRAAADQALMRAMHGNALVATILLAESPEDVEPLDSDDDDALDQFEEAADYGDDAHDLWAATPGALDWLEETQRATRRRPGSPGRGGQRR